MGVTQSNGPKIIEHMRRLEEEIPFFVTKLFEDLRQGDSILITLI